uniref:Translocase of outer mitochondrial membrane 20b n=1 Tax=Eptatretus burgeri TaxID=7764 RepID=A0A8C4R732_EPTBU
MVVGRSGAIAAAGICGAAFVGYCIYFDRKRRSEPDFKNKLRESKSEGPLPDLQDPEVAQKFFLEEIQLGEDLLSRGEMDEAVQHLSNAVAVCGQPQQLLQVFMQTLPSPVFQALLQNLPGTDTVLASDTCTEDKIHSERTRTAPGAFT